MIPRPDLPDDPNPLREVLVRTLAVGRTSEEGHDVVEIRVVDLDGNVAASEGTSAQLVLSEKAGTTHCTQGCIRSLYHSGKRVDLRTVAFIDMRRWKRPLQPFPSTSMTYLYCVARTRDRKSVV
mgnify:FL=1